jgi:hypothetical protein
LLVAIVIRNEIRVSTGGMGRIFIIFALTPQPAAAGQEIVTHEPHQGEILIMCHSVLNHLQPTELNLAWNRAENVNTLIWQRIYPHMVVAIPLR